MTRILLTGALLKGRNKKRRCPKGHLHFLVDNILLLN
jgi:hypothetical protein